MEMSIDETVLELRWLKKVNQKILETDAKELDVDSAWIKHWESVTQALDIAIDTARKYQMMQADYKARLRADMVAMLTEIQLKCEENTVRWYVGRVDGKSDDVVLIDTLNEIIEQKINALKEN